MADRVQEAIKRTRTAFRELGLLEEDTDFSYITEELLQEYDSAEEKSEEGVEAELRQMTVEPSARLPCYYGNRAVNNGGRSWSFTNSNGSDRCDKPNQKCGSGHRWKANLDPLRRVKCPGNNPPGGIEGWKPGYGP